MTQPTTAMARAMELPPHTGVLAAHPRMIFHKGRYTYTIVTSKGNSQYTVSDGQHTLALPILWAMGDHAQTWVLERNGQLYESLVSYYPAQSGLNITTGDEQLSPASLEDAVGRPIGADEARACFNCHGTHALHEGQLNFKEMHPGISCARCHVGADEHMAGMSVGSASAPIPPSLGQLQTEDMGSFCGQCHRSWETVIRAGWKGPADVRFQPYRLENSRCFNGSDPRISCVACHDPHKNLVQNVSYYDAKCLACHGTAARPVVSTAEHQAKTCPVAKSRCITCHMPKEYLPNGLLRFTDHQIRIVRANEGYPN